MTKYVDLLQGIATVNVESSRGDGSSSSSISSRRGESYSYFPADELSKDVEVRNAIGARECG